MITTVLSSKNQITFPKAILDKLNISKGDKLLISEKNGKIIVNAIDGSLTDLLAGSISVSKDKRGVNFEKALDKTKKIAAEKIANE